VIETSSQASKQEPMIKQIQLKREQVALKGGLKVPDLQDKMADAEKGHLTAL